MNKLWLTPFFLIFFSCVGTVQDTATPKTILKSEDATKVSFAGVTEAHAIADDKIEVFFYPATGGTGKFDYIISVGDIPVPFTVPSDVLSADYRGLLKYTVTNLDPAQAYVIKVEAKEQESSTKQTNDTTTMASTFPNDVANFVGVASVSNPQGIDGLDSIKIRWAHAAYDFSNYTAPSNPASYEIVVLRADLLNPSNFDDLAKGEAQGRYLKIVDYNTDTNEITMRGLPSDKKYYVRMRALHIASVNNYSIPRLRSEQNTNYLEISTLSANSPQFDTNSVSVTKNPGPAVTTSLNVAWGAVVGVFDHFRIYYGDTNASVNSGAIADSCIAGNPVGGVYCKKIDATFRSALIANLTALTTYQVMVVICQDIYCTSGKRVVSSIKTGTTTPILAGFNGVTSVSVARNVNEIGKLVLNFTPPDFTLGYFDGFIIGYKKDKTATAYDKISETIYTGPVTLDSFNYAIDSMITVNNISYTDGQNNCFNIYPFVYGPNLDKNEYNADKWVCVIPTISAPSKTDFPGISQAGTNPGAIFMTWAAPGNGVFTQYEVFWKKTAGAFSFNTAIAETSAGNFTNYGRSLAADYVTDQTIQFQLSNLPYTTYKVGVLTYYLNPLTINDDDPTNDVYRSENNDAVFTCVVNAISNPNCSR
jgi:hypothetical protein